MRTISSILTDIDSFYPEYKQIEKEISSCKNSLKRFYDKSPSSYDREPLIHQGFLLHYKKKTTQKWYLETLNEELQQINLVHMAKKIEKHHLTLLECPDLNQLSNTPNPLSTFSLPTEQYVRPYVKRRPPQIVEQEKIFLSELEEEIANLPLDEILSLYHGYSSSFLQHQFLYESLKTELQNCMLETNTIEVSSSIGTWKLVSKPADYDLHAMEQHSYIKKACYSFSFNKNQLLVFDHFSKESKPFLSDTLLLSEHLLYFTSAGLFIDDYHFSPLTKSAIIYQLENQSSLNEPLKIKGTLPLPGNKLVLQLPASTSKIEKMISKGFLHPSILSKMRYVESIEDITTYFEVIDVASHNKRMEQFMRTNMQRAQSLRYMNENAKEVLTHLTN